jgi:hypothetical protein
MGLLDQAAADYGDIQFLLNAIALARPGRCSKTLERQVPLSGGDYFDGEASTPSRTSSLPRNFTPTSSKAR